MDEEDVDVVHDETVGGIERGVSDVGPELFALFGVLRNENVGRERRNDVCGGKNDAEDDARKDEIWENEADGEVCSQQEPGLYRKGTHPSPSVQFNRLGFESRTFAIYQLQRNGRTDENHAGAMYNHD